MVLMPGVRWRVDTVTPPSSAALAVPLDVVRDEHLRVVNGTVDDAYITRIVQAATAAGERESWRSFLSQTIRLTLDRVPDDAIVVLPRPPVLFLEEVAYFDAAGALVPLVAGVDYYADLPKGPQAGFGLVRMYTDVGRPLAFTYQAGYGVDPTSIPLDLQQAILLLVGELYRTRSLAVQGTSTIPAIVQASAIFQNYRPY